MGVSRPSARWAPPAVAITARAAHSGIGSALPLSWWDPTSAYEIDALVSSRVVSSTHTWPGAAADCTRDAVFTGSPATMPCIRAPTVTATSPVTMPTRIASSLTPTSDPRAIAAATSSRPARTDRSASSSLVVGTPHTAITASPMNFSTTPP